MIDWGPGMGATGVGSPEAAQGADALRDRGGGPPEDDPTPRPGCLRTLISIIAILLGAALLVYLIGLATDLLR
jgi:hypothetical protein